MSGGEDGVAGINEGDLPGGQGDLPEPGAAIGGGDHLDRPADLGAGVVGEADGLPLVKVGGEEAGGGRRHVCI